MDSAVNSASFWGLGAILFALLNVDQSVASIVAIVVTVILGGATTCALVYLLVERGCRPVTARALAAGPPGRPVTPGVGGRLTMAWMLGTGVPTLGVVAVTAVKLVGGELDEGRALGAALVLGVLALRVRLAATLFV